MFVLTFQRISDRYKKQTEDLTRTSSINNNRTSITSGKDTSTTPSSYRPSSYSTSTKPATRTSTSTVSALIFAKSYK